MQKGVGFRGLGIRGSGVQGLVEALGSRVPQRAQYPLIKEYTLGALILRFKVYSLVEGYWALWLGFGVSRAQP